MSAERYPADAWGGTQVDAYAGGAAPTRALCPPTAHLTQAQWDDTEIPDQQFCMSTSSTTNMQCRAYKANGTEHCVFHLRQMAKRSAADGADA